MEPQHNVQYVEVVFQSKSTVNQTCFDVHKVLCTVKKKGGGEKVRGFSTVRGAPQNDDNRTCVRQAESRQILCSAIRASNLGSLFLFLRVPGSSGGAVTSTSGSTGYYRNKLNLAVCRCIRATPSFPD